MPKFLVLSREFEARRSPRAGMCFCCCLNGFFSFVTCQKVRDSVRQTLKQKVEFLLYRFCKTRCGCCLGHSKPGGIKKDFAATTPVSFPVRHCTHDVTLNTQQEFLAEMLDALHEDVNRVIDKPYVAAPDDDDAESGRSDQDLADEAWDRHVQRNRSVIVDLFQGQLKMECRCTVCNKKVWFHRSAIQEGNEPRYLLRLLERF